MCWECRECYPRHRLQTKPLFCDTGMNNGTCVTHVPCCMSGSLTRDGRENVPGIFRRMDSLQLYASGKRPIAGREMVLGHWQALWWQRGSVHAFVWLNRVCFNTKYYILRTKIPHKVNNAVTNFEITRSKVRPKPVSTHIRYWSQITISISCYFLNYGFYYTNCSV